MIRAVGLVVLSVCAVWGQAAAPAFEVASVKAASPDAPILDFRVRPGGRLEVVNQTLQILVMRAYNVKGYQLSGGPAWLDVDRYDIVATSQGNPSNEQVMAMLRTLLADRFQLKAHRESKEGDVFALTVGKNGSKLKPPEGQGPRIGLLRLTPRGLPGVKYALDGQKASMDLLATRLEDEVKRPVLNRTGLEGEFNFRLEYAIDDNAETGPSIFNALPEQLGLKLEKVKGAIETLVIEHAEKPSGN